MPDPLFPEPEDAFPTEEELLEGLDPPAPDTHHPGDDVMDRLKELMDELERERWLREAIEAWMRMQERLRRAVDRHDPAEIEEINETMRNGTDWPLGPDGPAYGSNTRDQWVPYVLPESPSPFERTYDLDEELEKALAWALCKLVDSLLRRVLPGGWGSNVVKRVAGTLARRAVGSLGIQGSITLRSDRLQVWMHLRSDRDGRPKIRRLSAPAYREALRIAQAPPVETFHLAGTMADLVAYVTALARLVADTITDPVATLRDAVKGQLQPGAFRPPDTSGVNRLVRQLQSGLFDSLQAKGLPCRPRITTTGNRVEYAYHCSRDVHFVPLAGPVEGANVPRLPDHLTGNVDFFPVALLNRVVQPAQMVFLRYHQLLYHAEVTMSHGTDLEKLLNDVASSLGEATVRAVVKEALNQAGLDKVNKALGIV